MILEEATLSASSATFAKLSTWGTLLRELERRDARACAPDARAADLRPLRF
jgi:hypothetical protein